MDRFGIETILYALYIVSMFEFDPAKSAANRTKHGIDFDEAQAIWRDQRRLWLTTSWPDEERLLVVGMIEGKHWTAIYTPRAEKVRLISVRRSRPKEAQSYDNKED